MTLSIPLDEIKPGSSTILARLEEHDGELVVILHEDGGEGNRLEQIQAGAATRVHAHGRTWRFDSLGHPSYILRQLGREGHQVVIR